jgi:hypothetical protein
VPGLTLGDRREKGIMNLKDGRNNKPGKVLIRQCFLPICAQCKRIRTDADQWEQIEGYLLARFGLEFTHTLCPSHLEQEIGESSAARNSQDELGNLQKEVGWIAEPVFVNDLKHQ